VPLCCKSHCTLEKTWYFCAVINYLQMDKKSLLGHLSAAGAYIIFGLNIVFCKGIANSDVIPPMALFSLRAIGASALFWLLSFFMPEEKVTKEDFPKIALASIVGLFIPQTTFLVAVTMTTAFDVGIMSTLAPIFTMFIAAIVLKEPITAKKAGGVAVSFCGVLMLIFNSVSSSSGVASSSPLGIFLMLINGLSFASYLGIFRPLIGRYGVVTFMKWMFLASLLISLPFSAKELITTDYASIPPEVAFEIGFLVFFATFVAYFLIPVGQKYLRPTLVSMYSYVQPLIAAVMSIAMGMDVLTWQKVLATVLIFTGLYFVNRSKAKAG